MNSHHDVQQSNVVSCESQKGSRYGIHLVIGLIIVGIAISLVVPVSNLAHLTTANYVLVLLFGVLAGISRTFEKKLGKSAFLSRINWFDFGSALTLIAALYSHPIVVLVFMVATEIVGRLWLGKDSYRINASVANVASDFIVITMIVCFFQVVTPGAGYMSNLEPGLSTVLLFGFAAFLHEVGSSVVNPLMFNIVDGKVMGLTVTKIFAEEKKTRAILCAAYVLLTMFISGISLSSTTMVTVLSAAALLGCIFFLRLWLQVRGELRGEHSPGWLVVSQQFASNQSQFENDFVGPSRVTIATNCQDEPVWNLAAMAFKILHTNQDRFVRHSLATGRLCEMVGKELEVQLGDTVNIDTEESWVIGVLHDVALMDQPTQVLRFAERVERPIDLEMYEEKKEGGMMHLNLVDHRLPDVTSEDTDVLDEHPKIGAQLLAGWPNVAKVIEQHHTFSTDYDQLPLLAQILFVCEKYELLASENGYYATVSKDEAIDAIREEYESIQEHPQVLNALITVLHNHDESFWNATDLDYDQQVQIIAPRLKAYADKQAPQSAPDQPNQTELKSFHPFERHQAYATSTPHTDNSLS